MKYLLALTLVFLSISAVQAQTWTHTIVANPQKHNQDVEFDGIGPSSTGWSSTMYKVNTISGWEILHIRENDTGFIPSEGTTYFGTYKRNERDPEPGNWNYQLYGGHFRSKLYSGGFLRKTTNFDIVSGN